MQAAGGQLDVLARSQPIDDVAADPATRPATRERSSSWWPRRASSRCGSSDCRMARASGATPISAARMRSGAWSRHPSSRSSRSAGASRSPAAWPTSASSTPRMRNARADRLAATGRRRQRRRRGDLFDARAPAGSGVQHDARLARAAPARHDLSRARARAALRGGRQRVQRSLRERRRRGRHASLVCGTRSEHGAGRLGATGEPRARVRRPAGGRACAPGAPLRQRRTAGGDAPREGAGVRAAQVRVRTASGALGRIRRLRRMVRPGAQQRASRGGRDLRELRAGPHARARGGRIVASVPSACRGAWPVAACRATRGGVHGAAP